MPGGEGGVSLPFGSLGRSVSLARSVGGAVSGEPAGTVFLSFGSPAIDAGLVGGIARTNETAVPQEIIYGGDETVQARAGDFDSTGATYLSLGDPVFGGEAVGFAATARQNAAAAIAPFLLDERLAFDGALRIAPVRPGDELTARGTVLATRASRSRPELGLVSMVYEVFNQAGTCVLTERCTQMLGRRDAAGVAKAPSA